MLETASATPRDRCFWSPLCLLHKPELSAPWTVRSWWAWSLEGDESLGLWVFQAQILQGKQPWGSPVCELSPVCSWGSRSSPFHKPESVCVLVVEAGGTAELRSSLQELPCFLLVVLTFPSCFVSSSSSFSPGRVPCAWRG